VKSLSGSLSEIIPDHQALAIRFKRELVEPCTKETKQEATTQTPTTPPDSMERQNDPVQRRGPLAVRDPLAVRRPVGIDPCSGLLDTR